MNGFGRAWLVALREIRERGRSRGFLAGSAIMLVVVVAMIALPSALDTEGETREVGVTGTVPAGLITAIEQQGEAAGVVLHVQRYDDKATGQDAVRDEDVDVLVVDGRRLEWREAADEELQALLAGAIQLVVVQQRAEERRIPPDDLLALVAPVPIESVEIGLAEGRSAADTSVALVVTVILLMAIFLYGSLVLTGVVEEKSSRVVEVLLARVSARDLLVGKIAGIGLLGLAQLAITAVAALVTIRVADPVDIPALDGEVLVWAVGWFVLGYALYATAYGALGSLASRTEDAQSVAGPVGYVLIAAYWAGFLAVGEDPDGVWARLASLFPGTAPFAMPGRIALGSTDWWEPVLAVALALVTVAGLAALGARMYTNALLHTGPALRFREAWRGLRSR